MESAHSSALPHPANFIDGYEIVREIGSGGYGRVFLCRNSTTGELCALKEVFSRAPGVVEQELTSVIRYREVKNRMPDACLMPIEHVTRTDGGIRYVMPLADGVNDENPSEPSWQPWTLEWEIEHRRRSGNWFSADEIRSLLTPVVSALTALSGMGLIHRDVKPPNILKLKNSIRLGDIGLLDDDQSQVSRRGTPGFSAPSWYVESGGHPDMYGLAATLFTLLTGQPPDKIGRSAFWWPPCGKDGVDAATRKEWTRLHRLVLRAIDERPAERFPTFEAFGRALSGDEPQGVTRRKSIKLLVGSAIAGAIAIVVGGSWWRSAPPPGEEKAPSPNIKLTPDQVTDYKALVALAQASAEKGNFPLVIETISTLWKTYPVSQNVPAYSLLMANALLKTDQPAKARSELEKEIHIEPSLGAITLRSDMWEELGDLPAAEKQISRIIDRFTPTTLHYMGRAHLRCKLGDYAGAQQDKLAALALPGGDEDYPRAVAAIWDDFADQFPGFREYLEKNPSP